MRDAAARGAAPPGVRCRECPNKRVLRPLFPLRDVSFSTKQAGFCLNSVFNRTGLQSEFAIKYVAQESGNPNHQKVNSASMTQVNNHETSVGLLPGVGKAAYVSKNAQSSAILPILS